MNNSDLVKELAETNLSGIGERRFLNSLLVYIEELEVRLSVFKKKMGDIETRLDRLKFDEK